MRLISFFLIIAFVLFFGSGCKPQEKPKIIQWELQSEKTFIIPNKDNVPAFVQFVSESKRNYVIFFNYESKKLLKYDATTTSIVDSIPIKILPNDIWAIKYISKDTIFIAYNASENPNYNHSGTIIQINDKGELKQKFSLKGFPIKCDECGLISNDSLEYVTLKYGALLYNRNNLFVQFESYYSHPGDSNFINKKLPVSGHINIKNGTTSLHEVYIPSILGKSYPKRVKVPSIALDENGNPVLGFSISSRLYNYDLDSKTTTSHYVNSFWGDTLMPLDTSVYKKSRPQDDYTQISFRNIIYDPYRKIYLRFNCLPLPVNTSPQDRRNPDYSLTIIDKDFNLIAEGILPKNLSPLCYITKEHIYFWDTEKNPIGNTSNISFSGYNLSFIKGDKNDLIKQLRVRDTVQKVLGFEAYVNKNFKIPTGKSAVFFIPVSACKPCISAATKYAVENQSKYPIYLVFGAENSSVIKGFTSEYNFNDKSKVLQDSTLKYEKFLEPPVLNGTIGFFENGKMVKEIKIIPSTSEEIKFETKKFLQIK